MSAAESPIWIIPYIIAIVAGTAPLSLTAFSTARAVSLFMGYCIPWVIIVDSKATIGFPLAFAI